MLHYLTIKQLSMANSQVTTESGGRQNMFPAETRPYIDESVSYDGYPQNAEKVNGRWAMIGFVALLGAYITCLLYTSPSPRDVEESRMPSSA